MMSMDGHTFGFLIQLMTCSFSILRLDTSMPPLLCAHSQRMVGRQCPFDQQWTQLVVVSNVERNQIHKYAGFKPKIFWVPLWCSYHQVIGTQQRSGTQAAEASLEFQYSLLLSIFVDSSPPSLDMVNLTMCLINWTADPTTVLPE